MVMLVAPIGAASVYSYGSDVSVNTGVPLTMNRTEATATSSVGVGADGELRALDQGAVALRLHDRHHRRDLRQVLLREVLADEQPRGAGGAVLGGRPRTTGRSSRRTAR